MRLAYEVNPAQYIRSFLTYMDAARFREFVSLH